jgi:hypothetical protein
MQLTGPRGSHNKSTFWYKASSKTNTATCMRPLQDDDVVGFFVISALVYGSMYTQNWFCYSAGVFIHCAAQ